MSQDQIDQAEQAKALQQSTAETTKLLIGEFQVLAKVQSSQLQAVTEQFKVLTDQQAEMFQKMNGALTTVAELISTANELFTQIGAQIVNLEQVTASQIMLLNQQKQGQY